MKQYVNRRNNKLTNINDLQEDPFWKVLLLLSLKDTLSMASVNKKFNTAVIKDNSLWKAKVARYFPLVFDRFSDEKIDWHAECRKAHESEHNGLSREDRKFLTLLTLVKEGDNECLEIFNTQFMNELSDKDEDISPVITTAQRFGNQKLLNHMYQFYQSVKTDTQKVDERGRTILYWAIVCRQSVGHIDILLSIGSSLNETYFGPQSLQRPIHAAAMAGHVGAVELFIAKNPNLREQPNADGETPLICAAKAGYLNVVKSLISRRVNLNIADRSEKTAIYWAVKGRYSQVVIALLDAKATVTIVEGRDQIIHAAVRSGNVKVVETLLENNPKLLEQPDANGNTPLSLATLEGHLPIVRCLVKKGASLNVANIFGKTPIDLAVERGHSDIVTLLAQQSNVDATQPTTRCKR